MASGERAHGQCEASGADEHDDSIELDPDGTGVAGATAARSVPAISRGALTMDTQRWELAGSIFERLLGAPQEKREVLLETLCGADDELKHVVMSMLQSESSALRFDRALAAHELPTATVDPVDSADSLPGSRVGPWLLVRRIGTGGMGVVWLGERVDGQFEQRAALKLIKRGMDSEAVLKRFLRERQILARLVHPHIAHLLDGGIAADGRPYFAMEYVEGLPLLRYCTERGIHLEERIRLFLRICDAVQFAHTNHVVHRDLKPSNILITASGDVKLLDFGIAKLLESEDGLAETITQFQRERPMTPMYAAPEQIRGDRITEATDVYALGCVLYELLTGQPARDLSRAANIKDVLQIVETTDPVAPSRLKISSMPVARKRLRGDLDTIVLTALRRDPARRYPSAGAFAADLKNYLDGKPIVARGDSLLYRGYKRARRHRAVLAASFAISVIAVVAFLFELRPRQVGAPMAAGSGMAIVDFNNLSRNSDSAWLAPALAEMLATELVIGGSVHILPDELVRAARADLAAPLAGGYAPQSLATLRKRLGADYVLSGSYFVSGDADGARLRLDLALQDARSGRAIANVAQSGALADLPALVEKAGLSLRERFGVEPATDKQLRQADLAQPPSTAVARRMGLALDALGKNDAARARDELMEALALAPGYAPAYLQLARAWKKLGYDAKALAAAQQAAANSANLPTELQLRIAHEVAVQKSDWAKAADLGKQLIVIEPQNPELHLLLIDDLLNAGDPKGAEAAFAQLRRIPGNEGDPRIELAAASAAESQGDTKAQAQHAERALQQAQLRDEPALAAEAKRTLGLARNELGNRDEGEALMREAIADYQRIANPKAEANARTSLANILLYKDQPQAVREEYQRALAIYERIGDQNGLAALYSNLANVLWSQGDRDAAETAVRRSLEIRKETGNLGGQAWNLTALAQMQLDEAASDEVMDEYRLAISLDERAGERSHHVYALTTYSEALRLRGELEAAGKVCAQAQDEARQTTDPYSVMTAGMQCAAIARDRGDIETAIAGFGEALKLAQEKGYSAVMANADLDLAQIDMAGGRFDAARERLIRAIEKFVASGEVVGEATAQSLVALCYAELGKTTPRDRAADRARELRSAITARQEAAVIDISLRRLRGMTGHRSEAAADLREFAADAEKRHWLAQALEAYVAAVQLLQAGNDPAAVPLRQQVVTLARQHGFAWILTRLSAAGPQPTQ